MKNTPIHTFHIPVMGLAYTIDSPIRVAQYGISSVISITDDELIERMRAFYSKKFAIPYQEISQKLQDYRAQRITSYLNLVDRIVKEKFENFKKELTDNKTILESFTATLPNKSDIKGRLENLIKEGSDSIKTFLEEHLSVITNWIYAKTVRLPFLWRLLLRYCPYFGAVGIATIDLVSLLLMLREI